MAETVRQTYVDELTPVLPKRWRIVPYQTNLDKLANVVVMLKQQTFEPLPEAPAGWLKVSVIVTCVSPLKDIPKAEDQLDDAVLQLITDLEGIESLIFQRAEKVLFQDEYIAYDLHTEVHTRKEA